MATSESDSGAIPSSSVKKELQDLLEADTSRLGEVYRLSNEGKSAEAISEELGVATSTFVSSYRLMYQALLEGNITEYPSVARRHASRFRSILEHGDLSIEAQTTLEQNLKLLEANSHNDAAIKQESKQDELVSDRLEALLAEDKMAGVYVFSTKPIMSDHENEAGFTLYKVGQSTDIKTRLSTVSTGNPYKLLLLRVYEIPSNSSSLGDESLKPSIVKIERIIHDWLNIAGHGWTPPDGTKGGGEWFMTSLEFLDKVASTLGLKIYAEQDIPNG